MKKGLVFILAVIYITLTSGVMVNIHYCMGRVAGVTYGTEADHRCDKCGMEQRKGCCHTKHKLVKADDDHIFAKSVSAPLTLSALAPKIFPELDLSFTPCREHYNTLYHSPPDLRGNNLAVYNSVFRI